MELYEKTLGILGFGRIGQLVAGRAKAFGMRVVAFDPYVGAERYRDLGVEKAASSDDVYAVADFLTLHLPNTPDTKGWLDAEALAKCKDGVRILNVARGPLVVDEDLRAALDSGKVAGAALDVFLAEPVTDHPLFSYPNVIMTPHLGASTAEATDRAGYQAAEQVIAALTGGVVTSAVNVPAIPPEDMEVLGPFVPLCRALGRIAIELLHGSSVDRVQTEFLGRIAERDTRLLSIEALLGVLRGHTEEDVNEVNAPAMAEERGIDIGESRSTSARDYTDLVRVTVSCGEERVRVAGTLIGRRGRPHLLEAWGQRFDVQLEDHIALFRYRDLPGMIGRVGTSFGRHGVNIVSAAVGRQPDEGQTAPWTSGCDGDHHRRRRPARGDRRDRRLGGFRGGPNGHALAGAEIMHRRAGWYTLAWTWRSASTLDFFSSPFGGNSAWAAAPSRETSTEKKQVKDKRRSQRPCPKTTTEY